jgi:hypothetical protein
MDSRLIAGFRLFFVLFGILSVGNSHAITIRGKAISFQNQNVTLEACDDFISLNRKTLTRAAVNENGEFTLTAEVDFSCNVFYIRNGRWEIVFYGNPNGEYQIEIPAITPDVAIRFDKVELPAVFISGTDSLHQEVAKYYESYDRFLEQHYYDYALQNFAGSEAQRVTLIKHSKNKPDLLPTDLNNRDSLEIKNFRILIKNFSDTVLNLPKGKYPFLEQLRNYQIAKLELVAGAQTQLVVEQLFNSNPPMPEHPGYVECAEMLFSGLFTSSPKNRFLAAQKALNSGQWDSLEVFQQEFPMVSNFNHRQIAYCIALRDMLSKNQISSILHDALLQQIADGPKTQAFRNIASRLIQNSHRCKKNAVLNDFESKDNKNKTHLAHECEGKLTYFLFYASWNSYSMKQVQAMEALSTQFGQSCNFVAISLDERESDWREAIKGKKWKTQMWYAGDIPELRDQYCLSSIPTALLISPQGTYINDYTKLPEDGVGAQIEKWLLAHPGSAGKGTWKEH